jgi:hypothetical protein
VTFNFKIAYSDQYEATNSEGHEHPPPTFGAPTLVWHLAISPHWPDPVRDDEASLRSIHDELASIYEDTRKLFFDEVNELLRALQAAAGFPRGPIQTFDARTIPAPWDKWTSLGEPFYVAKPGSIRFTLWWPDSAEAPAPQPSDDALRIKVHAAAHRDYVTLSIYLDVLKPWDGQPQQSSLVGKRRSAIAAAIDGVRTICEPRMRADPSGGRIVDREILPETGVSASEAADLMQASRYLYAQVWDDFCTFVGADRFAPLPTCRVFANFRGLVMATDGLPEAKEERPFSGSSGVQPFPRFHGNGGLGRKSSSEQNEANAVVKAFWPFIRRVTPDADRKEFVACGLMGWRALYVTALNCPPSYDWMEEASGPGRDIPSNQLPERLGLPAAGPRGELPVHYLVLTKGEPHRRQIGRIVERINAMGSMRLIALRDYNIIREASTHIQLRGQELDRMMRKWSLGRAKIRDTYDPRKIGKTDDALSEIQDEEDKKVQALADTVEKDLIDLSAALDEVGIRAVHGLHFRINRSRYYVCEFESLMASLKIGNIDTWVSYDQFVTRGLKPAFDFIDGVGTRLLGLRTRLQSVLEGIETSALVKQTSATRENTAQLKTIARAFTRLYRLVRWIGIALATLSLIVTLLGLQGHLGRLMEWMQRM